MFLQVNSKSRVNSGPRRLNQQGGWALGVDTQTRSETRLSLVTNGQNVSILSKEVYLDEKVLVGKFLLEENLRYRWICFSAILSIPTVSLSLDVKFRIMKDCNKQWMIDCDAKFTNRPCMEQKISEFFRHLTQLFQKSGLTSIYPRLQELMQIFCCLFVP